eukprot:356188-Chlamydomonas_euryale.AAC.9
MRHLCLARAFTEASATWAGRGACPRVKQPARRPAEAACTAASPDQTPACRRAPPKTNRQGSFQADRCCEEGATKVSNDEHTDQVRACGITDCTDLGGIGNLGGAAQHSAATSADSLAALSGLTQWGRYVHACAEKDEVTACAA